MSMLPLLENRITIARGAPPVADFVFVSTDINGTPGELNQYVRQQLGLGEEGRPRRNELSAGYAIQKTGRVTLIYVVTVGGRSVKEDLTKNMAAALAKANIERVHQVWIPLMGTGVGGLSGLTSLSAILDAIELEGSLRKSGAKVTISAPDTFSGTEYEALRQFYLQRAGIQIDDTTLIEQINAVPPLADDPSFEYGSDLWALVSVAEALARHRVAPSPYLSTTILMFALTWVDHPGVPQVFATSAAAKHFSSALKNLAGVEFKNAWNAYFLPNSDGAASAILLKRHSLKLTRNCANWFRAAAQKSRNDGRQNISIGDLISAFGEQTDGRARQVLGSMKVSPTRLLAEYARRSGKGESLVQMGTNIYDHLVHDHATSVDLMDFNQYAIAITSFLTSSDTHGPISISIQAPWGAGKSSLMQQVRHILDKEVEVPRAKGHATIRSVLRFLNRKSTQVGSAENETDTTNDDYKKRRREERWTVWFNAWKYESSEQVWAGLVDAIISQVSNRLSPAERELFLLRLNLARIDDGEVRKKIYDRLASYWWVGARWILLVAAALPAGLLALGHGGPANIAAWTSGGLGSVLTLWLVRAWCKVWNEPATFSLAAYVRVPDYGKSVGVVHQIHQDLQRIIKVLPKRRPPDGGPPVTQPLVIFVDDLDRCSPNKVASIVEGINTFLASDQREFMFVIGMDPQMVAAALEHAHKDVKSYLPIYEQSVPLGWRFMDKFIQLAFTIPPRRGSAIAGFVSSLTSSAHNRSEVEETALPKTSPIPHVMPGANVKAGVVPSPEESAQLQQVLSETVTNESEDVQKMMAGITEEFFCSPREIKRILNFVRFVLLLRVGRISRQEPVPALELYQRWIVLCMRWPDMARWLQWGTDATQSPLQDPPLDGLTARRLSILEIATVAPRENLQEWGTSAARDMGLAGKNASWLTDPDLHRFFINEATRAPDERLSHGASVGFY